MLSTAVLIVDAEISEQYCKLNLNLLKISTGRRLTSWLLTKRGGVVDPSSSREKDLNSGPPDYKSSALTTRPSHLHCHYYIVVDFFMK